jgi:hypothetical protein
VLQLAEDLVVLVVEVEVLLPHLLVELEHLGRVTTVELEAEPTTAVAVVVLEQLEPLEQLLVEMVEMGCSLQ